MLSSEAAVQLLISLGVGELSEDLLVLSKDLIGRAVGSKQRHKHFAAGVALLAHVLTPADLTEVCFYAI